MNPCKWLFFIFLVAAVLPMPCYAARTLADCKAESRDLERLDCYDDVSGYKRKTATETSGGNGQGAPAAKTEPAASAPRTAAAPAGFPGGRSRLADSWLLGKKGETAVTELLPYRPIYFITTWASGVNAQPASPAPGHSVLAPGNLDAAETKFQLSFKSEVLSPQTFDKLLGTDKLRLWFAYTQQSQWQLYNGANSAPFRESNYEPEAILTYDNSGQGSNLKLVNFGFVHQSNGRSLPESRSWNRLYAQGGWQFGDDLSVLGRLWWRIPESAAKDDNPDIVDYVGRGDATLRYQVDARNKLSLLARNNLRAGSNRGFAQIDWATQGIGIVPLGSTTWLHLQIAYGYGESLVDYNFKQKRIGIGVSFGEW